MINGQQWTRRRTHARARNDRVKVDRSGRVSVSSLSNQLFVLTAEKTLLNIFVRDCTFLRRAVPRGVFFNNVTLTS